MQRIPKENKATQSTQSLKEPSCHYFSYEQLQNPLQIPLSKGQEVKTQEIKAQNKMFKIDRKVLTLYGNENQEEIVNVQNIGKQPMKMLVTIPKTKYFRIAEEQRSFILAAGMNKKISIELVQVPNDQSCLDFVQIQTQKLSQKIEINWYKLRPTTQYKSLINLDKIQAGKTHNIFVEFKNKSKFASRKITLTKDPLDSIQLQSDSFKLKPLQTMKVEFVLLSQTQGVYHHKIIVEEEGNLQAPIEIVYAAIKCVYRMEDQNGVILRDIDFGTLLKGTKKEINIWANNSGPKDVDLKIKVKIGRSLRAESSLQSPQEFGVQCSSTVIEPSSKMLKVSAFSKTKISLTAFLNVQAKQFQLVERLAKSQSLSSSLLSRLEKQDSEHQQVLVCQFSQSDKAHLSHQFSNKPIISVLPMKVYFSLPAIKVSPSALYLGTITSGSSYNTSLVIDNLSCSTKFTMQVGKILNSECFLLNPFFDCKESHSMDVITKGGNLGQFRSVIQLTLASIYQIKIPIEYEVVPSEGTINKQNKLLYTAFEENTNSDVNFTGTLELVQREKNKKKYGVPIFRRMPVKSKSSVSLFQPQTNSSIRNSSSRPKQITATKDQRQQDCLISQKRMFSSHSKKYPLFVTRKIDKYSPFQEVRQTKKLLKSKNCKDYFSNQVHRQAKNRKEAEEIERELTPEELKLITIGEKVVSFGRLFVKSHAQTEWTIMNQTQGSIQVQIKDNTNDPKKSVMISNSDFQPQIVPSQGAAKFKLAFQAINCGKFQSTLIYTLNKMHSFQLLITAEVELVTLTPSKTSLKMGYAEETDLLLSDTFNLKNEGNITAFFNISQSNDRFKIIPSEGEVLAGQSKQIMVVESQKMFPIVQAGEIYGGKNSKVLIGGSQFEERIFIKINDGNDISLKAIAQPGLADPRCLVKQSKLNFGCTIVSKQKQKTFQLKNLSRTLSIFQILTEECSDFLTFDCLKSKIPPEGSKQISVTYKSGIIQTINTSFKILIRGGLVINVPISAESIAPEISIIENNFSFGEICYDTASIKQINIRNNSEIPVQLFLNTMSKQKGVQFLMPSFWAASSQPIKEGYVPKKTIVGSATYGKGTGIEEEIIDNAVHQPFMHKLKIQPKSIYTFHLIFKSTAPGYYEFMLPIYLEGLIRNDSLSKVVSCLVIEPRFIVEPPLIRFKTKIINDKDSGCFHPFVQYLTLRNPTNNVLKWKLDMGMSHKSNVSFLSYSEMSALGSRSNPSKEMVPQQKSCFEIEEKKGELRSKESVSINVSFNPIEEGAYYHKVPLYIFNQEKGIYQQESQVRLEGQGKYPSLYFNRRELILPAVPLGIEAIGMFEVYNDGYQSINLKHRFEISDLEGNIHISRGNLNGENGLPQLSLSFPQENKLTTNKRQLIVMVKFLSKKPISFTCKLQLYDDSIDCRVYSLPLSATADNSLLSTFTYLADPQNIYKLESIPLQPEKRKKVDETYTIWLKSNDGRNLIDRYHSHYDELSPESLSLSCRIVKRWINFFLREERVREFPLDLAQNPDILLKLLQKMTGRKQFDSLFQTNPETGFRDSLHSRSSTSSKLLFYQNIIRQLKQFGCLLNHIRPEFLLQKQEFIQAMNRQSGWKYYSTYYTDNQQILHNEAWLILIFQLKAVFWCQRQKWESQGSKPQSNVYSISELTVLRWVKTCFETVNELEEAKDRFISFGKDYKDCVAPISCILRYDQSSQKERALEQLHKRPITPTEFTQNTKLLYQLLERLNIAPLIYEDEYQLCSDKEIFLLMFQLYELLPQVLPRGPTILFTCELGQTATRTIEIKNPSTKTVHYWVKLEGSKDFQVQEKESISIEPKSSFNFNVQFKGRLSIQQSAFLSFFSKQEGQSNSINGTAMVFELKSKTTGRKSTKIIEPITCPLYDSVCVKVLVENIFEECEVANFAISLIEENPDLPPPIPARKATQNSQDAEANLDNRPLNQFHCDSESVKIKKGSAAAIQLYFSPVRLGKAKCLLIFHDPIVGEFQYQITGTTEIPRPLQQLRVPQALIVGKKQSIDLNLPVYNNYLLKCQTLLDQRNTDKGSRKEKLDQYFRLQLNMDPKILEHITFPREVLLKGAKKDSQDNRIRLDCNFTCVLKDLVLDFLLLGDPRRDVQDVRRFRVALNIQHAPITQEIMMTTSARKTLAQPIPIENSTTKDWKIKITITENNDTTFTLKEGEKIALKEMIVRKGQTQNFSIFFEPKWVGVTSSKVIIHNLTTNQQIILSLKGVAEEPLSQDHIHIRAGTEEATLHTVTITNPYPQQLTYHVICDLEELQLPVDVTLEPLQTLPFNIYAKSQGGGSSQVGYIKFVDENGRFFWYSVVLESAEKKVREFSVELSGEVGSVIDKFIQFKNPFSKALHYKVQYPKGVGLQTKDQFTIYSHGTYQLKIKFTPERVIEQEVILKATSHEIGIFLYRIKLKARDENRRKVIQLSSEVGKTGQYEMKLENPRKDQIKINYTLTNNACFIIDGPEILQPGENISIIKFTPTTEGRQDCSIRIWGDNFPTRCLDVEGTGLAPYTIETIHFRTRIGQSALEVIRFANPNPKRSVEAVRVCLSEAEHGFFKVVGCSSEGDWNTQVKDLLAVPVQFLPSTKGYFESVLTIQCFHYQWKYLLKGTTNFREVDRIQQQFKTANKEQLIKRLKVPVPQYYGQPPSYFDKITLDHPNKQMLRLIRSWLKIKLNHHCQEDNEEKIVTALVKFRPKKEIKEVVKLILGNSKEEGPTLIYTIQLTVTTAEPDSSIQLAIESIKNVVFELNGLGKQSTKQIKMLKGNYCQAERNEESVKLRFKPTHLLFKNSKIYIDNLLLQNDEEQWNYEIKFVLKN